MKAKVHFKTSISKAGDIIEVLAFQNDLNYIYAICKSSNGELEIVSIENLQIIDESNQLSKDIQAQLILFKEQCEINAMLACNMQQETFKEDINFAQKWLDIHKEEPEYYQPILADNGKYMAVVARVSDGDEDFYPICGTHVYMNPDPIKWRPIKLK